MSRRLNIDAFERKGPARDGREVATMSYLKGNYKLGKPVERTKETKPDEDAATKEFETFARERLGGSIAFVMKKNKFLWDGEKD